MPLVIPSVKNDMSSFFFYFVLIFFPTVIPSVCTEGIFPSVKSLENLPTEIIPRTRKFTDENIPSVFPFVFINFLVVVIFPKTQN